MKEKITINDKEITLFELKKCIVFIENCNTFTKKILEQILNIKNKTERYTNFILSKIYAAKNVVFSLLYSLFNINNVSEEIFLEKPSDYLELKEDVDNLLRSKSYSEEDYQKSISELIYSVENLILSAVSYTSDIKNLLLEDPNNQEDYKLETIIKKIEENIKNSKLQKILEHVNSTLNIIKEIKKLIDAWANNLNKDENTINTIKEKIKIEIEKLNNTNKKIYEPTDEDIDEEYYLYNIISFKSQLNNEKDTFVKLYTKLKKQIEDIKAKTEILIETINTNAKNIIDILS